MSLSRIWFQPLLSTMSAERIIVTTDMNIISIIIITIIACIIIKFMSALMNLNIIITLNTLINRYGWSDDNDATCTVRRFKDRRCSQKYWDRDEKLGRPAENIRFEKCCRCGGFITTWHFKEQYGTGVFFLIFSSVSSLSTSFLWKLFSLILFFLTIFGVAYFPLPYFLYIFINLL